MFTVRYELVKPLDRVNDLFTKTVRVGLLISQKEEALLRFGVFDSLEHLPLFAAHLEYGSVGYIEIVKVNPCCQCPKSITVARYVFL